MRTDATLARPAATSHKEICRCFSPIGSSNTARARSSRCSSLAAARARCSPRAAAATAAAAPAAARGRRDAAETDLHRHAQDQKRQGRRPAESRRERRPVAQRADHSSAITGPFQSAGDGPAAEVRPGARRQRPGPGHQSRPDLDERPRCSSTSAGPPTRRRRSCSAQLKESYRRAQQRRSVEPMSLESLGHRPARAGCRTRPSWAPSRSAASRPTTSAPKVDVSALLDDVDKLLASARAEPAEPAGQQSPEPHPGASERQQIEDAVKSADGRRLERHGRPHAAQARARAERRAAESSSGPRSLDVDCCRSS